MLCIHFNKETHECSAYNLDEKFQGSNTEGTCTCEGLGDMYNGLGTMCDQYATGLEEGEDNG